MRLFERGEIRLVAGGGAAAANSPAYRSRLNNDRGGGSYGRLLVTPGTVNVLKHSVNAVFILALVILP